MHNLKILGLRVAVTSVVVGVILAVMAVMVPRSATASPAVANTNVRVVNVTDQGFGVAWSTVANETGGHLLYGASCAAASSSAKEVSSNGFVHLANTSGLGAGKTYFFKIVTSAGTDTNGGSCYQAKTDNLLTVPQAPIAIYGVTKTNGCAKTAPGSLVTVTVAGPSFTSNPLAVIAGSNGTWAVPFADATNSKGQYPQLGKNTTITYVATADGVAKATATVPFVGRLRLIGPETACA